MTTVKKEDSQSVLFSYSWHRTGGVNASLTKSFYVSLVWAASSCSGIGLMARNGKKGCWTNAKWIFGSGIETPSLTLASPQIQSLAACTNLKGQLLTFASIFFPFSPSPVEWLRLWTWVQYEAKLTFVSLLWMLCISFTSFQFRAVNCAACPGDFGCFHPGKKQH